MKSEDITLSSWIKIDTLWAPLTIRVFMNELFLNISQSIRHQLEIKLSKSIQDHPNLFLIVNKISFEILAHIKIKHLDFTYFLERKTESFHALTLLMPDINESKNNTQILNMIEECITNKNDLNLHIQFHLFFAKFIDNTGILTKSLQQENHDFSKQTQRLLELANDLNFKEREVITEYTAAIFSYAHENYNVSFHDIYLAASAFKVNYQPNSFLVSLPKTYLSSKAYEHFTHQMSAIVTLATRHYPELRNRIFMYAQRHFFMELDASVFHQMISEKYVPYPAEGTLYKKFPTPRNSTDFNRLGLHYFEKERHPELLATAIFDWTTANFFRQKLLTYYVYDGFGLHPEKYPVDIPSVSVAIARSNWAPYTPEDYYFMRSFYLTPLLNKSDVEKNTQLIGMQLNSSIRELRKHVISEARLFEYALRLLPKPNKYDVKKLARGAWTSALEIEEAVNRSDVNTSLLYDVYQGKDSFFKAGSIITTSTFWSFVNNTEDASKYSRGVTIVVSLPDNIDNWECPYITPFSNNSSKIEFVCPPGTQFLIKNAIWSVSNNSAKNSLLTLELEQRSNTNILDIFIESKSTQDQPTQCLSSTYTDTNFLHTLQKTALLSAVMVAIPEGVKDVLYHSKITSKQHAEQTAAAVNLIILLFTGSYAMIGASFALNLLLQWFGFSPENSRVFSNSIPLVLDAYHNNSSSHIAKFAVSQAAGKFGLWSEKRIVDYIYQKDEQEASRGSGQQPS